MGGKRRNLEEIKRLSVERYKNNVFDFSQFNYVNMKTKGQLTCPNGHTFFISPSVHLRDHSDGGCRKCANKKIGERLSDTPEQWLRKANETHGEGTYDYSKTEYRGQKNKVIITCRIHGDFEQNPTSHLQGCGCGKCGIEKTRAAKFLKNDEIRDKVEKCSHLHSSKYTYIVYSSRDGRLYVTLKCAKHGEFEQRLDHHLHGHGCVKCCSSISNAEREWIAYLTVSYCSYILQTQYKVPSTNFVSDAYCEQLSQVFEYHGDFWHGNPDVFAKDEINPRTGSTYGSLYAKTLEKHDIYERLGYKVSFVWESQWTRAKWAVSTLQRMFRSRSM